MCDECIYFDNSIDNFVIATFPVIIKDCLQSTIPELSRVFFISRVFAHKDSCDIIEWHSIYNKDNDKINACLLPK